MRAATWGIWTWVAVTVVPLVLVLLCCVGCFGVGVLGSTDTEGTAGGESTPVASGRNPSPEAPSAPSRDAAPSASAKPAEKKPKQPGIGDKVRDGKFEFTVTDVECGVPEVHGSYGSEKAQGRYCLVKLTVRNIGKAAQSFSYSNQKLYVGDVEYSATWDATWRANKDTDLLRDEINPGNRLKGVIVAFDVPRGAKPTSITLHDSFWSDGVTVSLK